MDAFVAFQRETLVAGRAIAQWEALSGCGNAVRVCGTSLPFADRNAKIRANRIFAEINLDTRIGRW
ncbi:hypothetical protein D3C84_915160 [compost metagenome]